MKKLVLAASMLAVTLASTLSTMAVDVDPPTHVPDSGVSIGLVALSLIGLAAIARKLK